MRHSDIENRGGEDNFREGHLKAVASKLQKYLIQMASWNQKKNTVNIELLIFVSTSTDKYSTVDYKDINYV